MSQDTTATGSAAAPPRDPAPATIRAKVSGTALRAGDAVIGLGLGLLLSISWYAIAGRDPVPDADQLAQGPAQHADTQLPEQAGDLAVAGHPAGDRVPAPPSRSTVRDIAAAPVVNIDQPRSGDPVIVETKSWRFVYRVLGRSAASNPDVVGQQVAKAVAGSPTQPLMKLTACLPRHRSSHQKPSRKDLTSTLLASDVSNTCDRLAVPGSGSVVWPVPASMKDTDRHNYGQTGAHWSSRHTGTDFSVPCGTPVTAATSGTIIIDHSSGWAGPNLVQVSTGPGKLTTWYAHMEKVTVAAGQRVAAGQQIGLAGAEGNTTGCHLHFEVHPQGGTIYQDDSDPSSWLAEHVVQTPQRIPVPAVVRLRESQRPSTQRPTSRSTRPTASPRRPVPA